MTAPSTHRILIWLSLALGIIMTSDSFILPQHRQAEVLDNGRTESIKQKSSRAHPSYYFLTKAGNKYHVNEYLYGAVLIGDTFQIYKSLVFRRPVGLSWCQKDGQCYRADIGLINGHYLSYGVMAVLILYPLLVLLGVLKITTSGKQTYVYLCFILALGTLTYYLVY